LIADQSLFTGTQLRLQEQLGRLLYKQARFVETAQTFMTMRYAAFEDGDLAAQAEAWLGLAMVQKQQANYQEMLESASQAEQVAWLVNAETALAQALLLKGEAYQYLGDYDQAINTTNRLIDLVSRLEFAKMLIQALAMMTDIYADLGYADQVRDYLKQVKDQVSRLKEQAEKQPLANNKEVSAFSQVVLGDLYIRMGLYEQATSQLLRALNLYREYDSSPQIGHTLNLLGDAIKSRGRANKAISLFREAVQIARSTGDIYSGMTYRMNLGNALVALGEFKTAVKELGKVINLAEDVSKIVNWHDNVKLYNSFALAKVGAGAANDAVLPALQAIHQADKQNLIIKKAKAWCVMGMVLAKATQEMVNFQDKNYYARDCFAESLKLLKSSDDVASFREQVSTLVAWSQYTYQQGDDLQSKKMMNQATDLAKRLQIPLPQASISV
jgi:tetratricopeptide (TPR) repeat protein